MNITEISNRLADRVIDVCQYLLPNGKQEANTWVVGDLSGDSGKSLKVCLGQGYAGKWRDWADDSLHGDLLDLWSSVKGISPTEARKDAMRWLGIPVDMALSSKVYKKPEAQVGQTKPSSGGVVQNYLHEERKLSLEVIERYRIECNPSTKEIIYPCYSPDGVLVNRCYIALKRDENGKKKVRQDPGCAPCVFGWQSFRKEDWEKRFVVLTEGQIDAMTFAMWGFPALSISNGSGMTWIDYNYEDLQFFETIFLSFDMDGKVPMDDVAKRLGVERCRLVKLPHKDANDCLKAGVQKEEIEKCVEQAKYMEMPVLVLAQNSKDQFLHYTNTRNLKTGFTHDLFWHNRFTQFYFRPSEVTIWAGISGHGKSSFLRWLFMEALKHEMPVGIASMEVPYLRTLFGMSLAFRAMTNNEATHEDFITHVGGQISLYNRVGYAIQKELLETIRYASRRYGTQHFMIDSLMRVQGLEEEYKAQGDFMLLIQEVAKTTGVHIHVVAHEKKGSDGSFNADNLKGSSLLRNNTDNLIFIRRNMEKRDLIRDNDITQEQADVMHDGTIVIEKDREGDYFCKVDFRYLKEKETFTRFRPLT